MMGEGRVIREAEAIAADPVVVKMPPDDAYLFTTWLEVNRGFLETVYPDTEQLSTIKDLIGRLPDYNPDMSLDVILNYTDIEKIQELCGDGSMPLDKVMISRFYRCYVNSGGPRNPEMEERLGIVLDE